MARKSSQEMAAWAEKRFGKENMQKVAQIVVDGLAFEVEFLKDPFEFCATHKFKVYNGLGPDTTLGKTYAFVHQVDIDSFALVWIYPNGNAPALVLGKRPLNNFITRYDFSLLDNEIFMLWLNENKAMLKKAHTEYIEEYRKIAEYLNGE